MLTKNALGECSNKLWCMACYSVADISCSAEMIASLIPLEVHYTSTPWHHFLSPSNLEECKWKWLRSPTISVILHHSDIRQLVVGSALPCKRWSKNANCRSCISKEQAIYEPWEFVARVMDVPPKSYRRYLHIKYKHYATWVPFGMFHSLQIIKSR